MSDLFAIINKRIRPYLLDNGSDLSIVSENSNGLKIELKGKCLLYREIANKLSNFITGVIQEEFPQFKEILFVDSLPNPQAPLSPTKFINPSYKELLDTFFDSISTAKEYAEANCHVPCDSLLSSCLAATKENNPVILKPLFDLKENYIVFFRHPDYFEDLVHKNDFIEMLFVYSGTVILSFKDEDLSLSENTMCILNKNVSYSIHPITNRELVYHIYIDDSIFDQNFFSLSFYNNVFAEYIYKSLYTAKENESLIQIDHVDQDLKSLINLLLIQSRTKNENRKNTLYSYMISIFTRLCGSPFSVIHGGLETNNSRKEEHLYLILNYIKTNYQNGSLMSASKQLFLHPNYLCKVIKDVTGKTFTEILNQFRMERAAFMLEMSEKSIDTIASEIGFNNSNYFYKVFKQTYDVTPMCYREAYRNLSIDKSKKTLQGNPNPNEEFMYRIGNVEYIIMRLPFSKDQNPLHNLSYQSGSSPRIAFLPASTEFNYIMTVGEGISLEAKKNNVDVITMGPRSGMDINGQLKLLEKAINQKFDAILLNTHDEYAAGPYIKRAIENGIFVCMINSDNMDLPISVHAVVGYKQRKGTYLLARYAIEKMKSRTARVGVIQGYTGYHSTERCEGFLSAIKNQPNFELLSILNGNWSDNGGYSAAMDMLQTHPDINLIFCANDQEAEGVIKAIDDLKKQDIMVFGNDGDMNSIKNILSGKQVATVNTNPIKMGQVALQVTVDGLFGKFQGGFVETPSSIIDKANVYKYMQSITPNTL